MCKSHVLVTSYETTWLCSSTSTNAAGGRRGVAPNRLIADSGERIANSCAASGGAPLDVASRMCERVRREQSQCRRGCVCATSDLDRDGALTEWGTARANNRKPIRPTRASHRDASHSPTRGDRARIHLHSLRVVAHQTTWKSRVSLRSGTQPAVGRARCRDDTRRPGCRQDASRPLYARGGNERRAAD
jgi:hypothetical protein